MPKLLKVIYKLNAICINTQLHFPGKEKENLIYRNHKWPWIAKTILSRKGEKLETLCLTQIIMKTVVINRMKQN